MPSLSFRKESSAYLKLMVPQSISPNDCSRREGFSRASVLAQSWSVSGPSSPNPWNGLGCSFHISLKTKELPRLDRRLSAEVAENALSFLLSRT
jgi:hypothetical protein